MTEFNWTPERVNALRVMADHGMSAREIGLAFDIPRNAVLGKCFREGIRLKGKNAPGVVRNVKGQNQYSHLTPEETQRLLKKRLLALGVDGTIEKMRAKKKTWAEIATALDRTVPTVRIWARLLGYNFRKHHGKVMPEQLDYLVKAWNEYVHVQVMADHIGRSYGVTRQIIMRLKYEGRIGDRDGLRSIAVTRYGCDYRDPRPSHVMLTEAVEAKKARKLNDEDVARRLREEKSLAALERMGNDIASGMSRDEAMLRARDDCTFEEIAVCFGITRERVRQICAKLEKRNGLGQPDLPASEEGGDTPPDIDPQERSGEQA